MIFRDQDSRSRLEVQVRGETETRLSKMCLETVSRPETGLGNSITKVNHANNVQMMQYCKKYIKVWFSHSDHAIDIGCLKYLFIR